MGRLTRIGIGMVVLATTLAGPVQPAGAAPVVVTTGAELAAAFGDPAVAEVVVAADLVVGCADGPLVRSDGGPQLIDGNGHSITHECPTEYQLFMVQGVALRLADVHLVGYPDSGHSIVFGNGDLAVQGSRLDGAGSAAMRIVGGTLEVRDSTLSADTTGIEVSGTDVVVERSSITGRLWGISQHDDGDADPFVAVAHSTVSSPEGVAVLGHHTVRVVQSTLTRSRVGLQSVGTARVENSAVTGNDTGIIAGGTLELVYSSVAGNGTPGQLGAQNLWVDPGTELRVFGSVIAQRMDQLGRNCVIADGEADSAGGNVVDDGSCALRHSTDRVVDDAGLSDASQGGIPDPDGAGPLVDAIPLARCQEGIASGVTADVTGRPRPRGAGCDVGAVELPGPDPFPVTTVTVVPATDPRPQGVPAPASPVEARAAFTG